MLYLVLVIDGDAAASKPVALARRPPQGCGAQGELVFGLLLLSLYTSP
ncbi:hypothetical protein [Hymenobacter coccineus]|nr:hypothetical protein [Hymenobacter coccineus]